MNAPRGTAHLQDVQEKNSRSIRSRLSPEQVRRVLKSQEGVCPSPVGLIDLL